MTICETCKVFLHDNKKKESFSVIEGKCQIIKHFCKQCAVKYKKEQGMKKCSFCPNRVESRYTELDDDRICCWNCYQNEMKLEKDLIILFDKFKKIKDEIDKIKLMMRYKHLNYKFSEEVSIKINTPVENKIVTKEEITQTEVTKEEEEVIVDEEENIKRRKEKQEKKIQEDMKPYLILKNRLLKLEQDIIKLNKNEDVDIWINEFEKIGEEKDNLVATILETSQLKEEISKMIVDIYEKFDVKRYEIEREEEKKKKEKDTKKYLKEVIDTENICDVDINEIQRLKVDFKYNSEIVEMINIIEKRYKEDKKNEKENELKPFTDFFAKIKETPYDKLLIELENLKKKFVKGKYKNEKMDYYNRLVAHVRENKKDSPQKRRGRPPKSSNSKELIK